MVAVSSTTSGQSSQNVMKKRGYVPYKFGCAILETIKNFSKNDITDRETIDRTYFAHVSDEAEKDAMTRVLRGARWLYKIALALDISEEELAVHVRAQVIDYVSVCETVLGDMIRQKAQQNINLGVCSRWMCDCRISTTSSAEMIAQRVSKVRLIKRIEIARSEGMIGSRTASALNRYREYRNTVHITKLAHDGTVFGLEKSFKAYQLMFVVLKQTQDWYKNSINATAQLQNIIIPRTKL